MQFIIKNTKKDTIYNLMRDLSYHFSGQDKRTGELDFTHPIRDNAFPRFHLFLKINDEDLIFNLHLDQKAPIYPVRNRARADAPGGPLGRAISNGVYKGLPAHQGEYSGPLVEKEAERIKQFLSTI